MPNIPCRKLSCSSRKGISFIHCSCVRMEKLSTVPGLPACLIVRMKEQSILFPTPFASANDRIPQKSRTAFLKVSKSLCSVVDIGKRAFSLWIKDFLLLSDIKKNSSKELHLDESRDLPRSFPPCRFTSKGTSKGCQSGPGSRMTF